MRFLTRLFHLWRGASSIPREARAARSPCSQESPLCFGKGCWQQSLELVSLAGLQESAAPAGGNSLLTGRDKCPGTEQRPQSAAGKDRAGFERCSSTEIRGESWTSSGCQAPLCLLCACPAAGERLLLGVKTSWCLRMDKYLGLETGIFPLVLCHTPAAALISCIWLWLCSCNNPSQSDNVGTWEKKSCLNQPSLSSEMSSITPVYPACLLTLLLIDFTPTQLHHLQSCSCFDAPRQSHL